MFQRICDHLYGIFIRTANKSSKFALSTISVVKGYVKWGMKNTI